MRINHEWEARINNRISGTGCPYCAGKAVCIDNCLQTKNPKLARQWHPTKNGKLTPRDVTPGSNKKVWWLCSHNHEWQAYVYHRNKGSGCYFLLASEMEYILIYAPYEKETTILKFIKSNLTVKIFSQFLTAHFHNSLQHHLSPRN